MTITLKLPAELEKRVNILSKKTHLSKSRLAREALENYIEDLEDYYLAKAVQTNPGQIYSAEEVRNMCGLDD